MSERTVRANGVDLCMARVLDHTDDIDRVIPAIL
jgi:hypothetical protein